MTQARRYGPDDVRKIFDMASREEERRDLAPSPKDGLTLRELEDIGREVGLEPDRITAAALTLEAEGNPEARGTQLGMPVSVGRILPLPRAPTDREWELLVAELKRTFNAKGRVDGHGSIREWSNGNLTISIEPTEGGHRLRMRTTKGTARPFTMVGVGFLGFGALVGIAGLLGTAIGNPPFSPLALLVIGGSALAFNAIRLPSWARRREDQMEYIARRAFDLTATDEVDDKSSV